MSGTVISSGNYRIEVSGWGLNDDFFVENTDLLWTEGGEKRLLLHQGLPEQAVIFVRLTGPDHTHGSVPVAYQVADVRPMNSIGLCEMRLLRLNPQTRSQTRFSIASKTAESSSNGHEPKESTDQPELEEVFHEA